MRADNRRTDADFRRGIRKKCTHAPPSNSETDEDAQADDGTSVQAETTTAEDAAADIDGFLADGGVPEDDDSSAGPVIPQLNDVEAVVLESYATTGVGGYAIVDYRPLILFKDGWVTRNTSLLVLPVDIAMNRASYPKSWFSWRMMDGNIQVLRSSGWETLPDQTRYAPLPKGVRFAGSFQRLTGLTVLISKTYSFAEDGGFRYYGAASGGLSSPVDEPGSYEIDGYQLVSTKPDGTTVLHALVYDVGSPVMFIDGLSYTEP